MMTTWNTLPELGKAAIAAAVALALFFASFSLARGDGKPTWGGTLQPAAADGAAPAIPKLGGSASVPALVVKKKKRRRTSSPDPAVSSTPRPTPTPAPRPPSIQPAPTPDPTPPPRRQQPGETIIVG